MIEWNDRRSADGRWCISREVLRGMTIWKLRDTTLPATAGYDSPDIVGHYRSMREAKADAERMNS